MDAADGHKFATNSAVNPLQIHRYRERCQFEHSRYSGSGHRVHKESLYQWLGKPNRGHRLLSEPGCRCDRVDRVSRLTLFFTVHADDRLACRLVGFDPLMNVFKLLIAVRVAASALTLERLPSAKLMLLQQLVYHRHTKD